MADEKVAAAPQCKGVFYVNTSKDWCDLQGQTIANYCTVFIGSIGDLHPFKPAPVFPDAKVVITSRSCDKNWVYYWLDEQCFPKANTIYMKGSPCEFGVLYRFQKVFSRRGPPPADYAASQFHLTAEYCKRYAPYSPTLLDESKIPTSCVCAK